MKSKKFDYVVGTGGIGTGILFKFQENTTLGRDESRFAKLADAKDYCKLHIILHYVATLGPDIPIYTIGKVGNDDAGNNIIKMMKQARINTDYIGVVEDVPTLYSVCFTYPDSDGGNITACNSASNQVEKKDIDNFFEKISDENVGLVLAAPEVPLEVREHLLLCGRKRGCFNTASFTSSEVPFCVDREMLRYIDFLSINKDEMRTFMQEFGCKNIQDPYECYLQMQKFNPHIIVVITWGKEGAFVFGKGQKMKVPAIWKKAVNSAGAGDCYMGTMIAAFLKGIPIFDNSDGVGIAGLAALASSIKVECKDTIDTQITLERLLLCADALGIQFTRKIYHSFFGIERVY